MAIALLGSLGGVALLGLPLSEEATWGFLYPALLPLPFRVGCAALLLAALVPSSNRAIRVRGSSLLARAANWPPRRSVLVILGFALVAFVAFQSRRLYGDSQATIDLLESGQLINWKEPLDRFITAVVFRVGRNAVGLTAYTAVAAVSTVAGLVWVATSLAVARSASDTRANRVLVAALLLTPGLIQLFFGNVENYSLLAAGILVYLWSGIRFLQMRTSLFIPALALGFTCWTHLAGAWLLPSFAFLYVSRVRTGHGAGTRPSSAWRWLWEGLVGLGIPTALTVAIASVVPSEGAPTFANFGGGDARMFIPLTNPSGPFEKFTLFGPGHLLAMANELILIGGAASAVVLAYLLLTPSAVRLWNPPLRFVLLSTGLLSAFSFLFNPDMAVFDVGVRNEWDLLAAPGIGLALLAGLLLVEWETRTEVRARVGLVAVVTSGILAGSWVLYNARWIG